MPAQGAWDGRVDLAWRMARCLRNHLRRIRLMRWVARVFTAAIIRRIAYVLVALFLAWSGVSRADAATCSSYTDQCTEGGAKQGALSWGGSLAACKAVAGTAATAGSNQARRTTEGASRGFYTVQAECSLNGNVITQVAPKSPDQIQWFYTKTCSAEPEYTGSGPWSSGGSAKNGSLGCRNGCDGMWARNVDSTMTWSATGSACPDNEEANCKKMPEGYFWNAVLKVCEPPEGKCPGRKENSLGQCAPEPCPEGKAQQPDGTCKNKDNECPAGQVKSPDGKCLPGDGQCAAGEVRGPDGTCKRDRDGDGEPDPGQEEDESFSGGDDCNAPPQCSGSPVMCGQARIQWRIDCNTRKNRNIAGGACNTPPVCTGEKCDALEYTGMLMQWRSACALEKLAAANGNGNGSNPDVAAIRDALTGNGGNPNYGTEAPGSAAWMNGGNTPPGKPNTAGYGWSGSCPQPPSFDVMGQSFQFNVTPLCNWLSLGSYFVLGLAALFSLKIVASKDA